MKQSTKQTILGAAVAVVVLSQPAVAASRRTEALVPAKEAIDLGRGRTAIAAPDQNRVYRLDAQGRATVLAGTGRVGFAGDEGLASEAMLHSPSAVAVDASGNLYIADTGNHRIRRVEAASRIITTVAGAGETLKHPTGLAVDAEGNLYVADTGNHRIRRIAASGEIETVAGTGVAGFSVEGELATSSSLNEPTGLAFDAVLGRLLVADTGNHRVVVLEADGTMRTLAGDGRPGFTGDGGPAVEARLRFPSAVSVDGLGNVLVTDAGNGRVRRVEVGGRISTIEESMHVVRPNDPMPEREGRTGQIVLTTPHKRVEWAVGSKHLIRWNHTFGKNTPFVVELSRDGGITWQPIGKQMSSLNGRASMTWTVSAPSTRTGLIRVRWVGDDAVVGVSAPIGIWYTD